VKGAEMIGKAKPSTTTPGYINRNGQVVVHKTGLAGHHNQTVYELRCPECQLTYGCNGADIFQRKCPFHQGGEPGLSLK
jgi:hypothetical protein